MSAQAGGTRLAVVTGGNRGLGREAALQLAAQGFSVVLAARELAQAREAAAALGGPRRAVVPARLDVTDAAGVRALAAELRARGVPIAALVNNAGIALDGFNAEVARRTLAVNCHGAARVTDALRPLLAPDGCVVMVSSGSGELAEFQPPLRERFLAPALTRAELDALTEEFVAAVARGDHARLGWPGSAYAVSKAALNALTRILAREWGPDGPRVNAVCPGWVRTRMGGRSASRNVKDGARGIVWAATLPPDGPRGGFFRDGEPIAW